MRVLVTGATGFIGSHLVERLSGSGAQLRALVRHGTDASSLDARGIEVVRGDVRDPDAVRQAMADQELVYHLARAPRGGKDGKVRDGRLAILTDLSAFTALTALPPTEDCRFTPHHSLRVTRARYIGS